MSGFIRVLTDDVADKIAAGEVIERPASVVKELLENAIDAGARSVRVDVLGAGKEYIRVSDDGRGMPPADAPKAFLRHATSKVRGASDLHVIRTLGFRGEALPSIASVSQVEMITHDPSTKESVKVKTADGRTQVTAWEAAPGTQVTVKNLFYNTPARLKFLKSDTGERRAIADYVTSMALAHPDIAMSLFIEERERLRTPGTGDLKEGIAAVFGEGAVAQLVSVEAESPWGNVSGYVGKPAIARGNRNAELVFINGRWVQNRMLHAAVEKGFDSLLAFRRFPLAVLHIAMDPSLIDVNVHPAKTEVRFTNEREVFRTIMHAVRFGLTQADLTVALGSPRSQPAQHEPEADHGSEMAIRDDRSGAQQGRLTWSRRDDGAAALREVAAVRDSSRVEHPIWQEADDGSDVREFLSHARVSGQLDRTYLVVVGADGLWLIDQHVAHERLLYEAFLAHAAGEPALSQELITPVSLSLSPAQAEVLAEGRDILTAAGFVIEEFGGNDYLLRAAPAEIRHDPAVLIQEMIDELADGDERRGTTATQRLAASYACRAAVKAGDELHPEESTALVRSLASLDNPFACPHGRPIIIQVNVDEIARRFGR